MVTVIESSDPTYGQQDLVVPEPDGNAAASSGFEGDIHSELVWTSWLGDSELWNLGFEHFDSFDDSNLFDNLNEFDNFDYFDHPA